MSLSVVKASEYEDNQFLVKTTTDSVEVFEGKYLNQINVDDYGLTGDGVVDDTTLMTTALTAAASSGAILKGGIGKTYLVSIITIPSGVKGFDFSESTILSSDGSTLGVIVVDSDVEDCFVKVNLNMAGGDYVGIYSNGASYNYYLDSNIYGFINSATLNHYGILLGAGSNYNKISGNTITGYDSPTQRGLLVDLLGEESADGFGGFFDGAFADPITPCKYNIVTDNILINGSYAINIIASDHNIIQGNQCVNQSHRGVYIAAGSTYNIINDNQFLSFGSSGVLLAYNAWHNKISCNVMRNVSGDPVGGEAGVSIQTGSSHNTVYDNIIDAGTNYGVYIACDTNYNIVDANKIKNYYSCAIAIENHWEDSPDAGALFSRPNYSAPPDGEAWSHMDVEGNVIINNVIDDPYPARSGCAIYLAQLASTYKNTKQTINGNIIRGTIGSHFFLFEETADYLDSLVAIGNTFDGIIVGKINIPRDHNHFRVLENNEFINDYLEGKSDSFTAGDATPSVLGWGYYACANSAATDITDFDDATEGQEIKIRLDPNSTIKYGSALIRPKGNADVTGNSNNFVVFKSISGVWFEQYRSF